MTCEVVVSNKGGLALAADSAVTLGPQQKVYHNAEKLFQLSLTEPVAIMTYGAAEFMQVPWEIIIKLYRQRLSSRHFDHVSQYAEDFLQFLESSNPLFPEKLQRTAFDRVVRDYSRGLMSPAWKQFGTNANEWPEEAWGVVLDAFSKDAEIWTRYDGLPLCGPNYGHAVTTCYEAEVTEIEEWLFDSVKPPDDIQAAFRHIIAMMHEKEWISPIQLSGVVIAGFGDAEVFPHLVGFEIGPMAAGKLRYSWTKPVAIDHDVDGCVSPFAQREMIDMFYNGIHPAVQRVINKSLHDTLTGLVGDTKETQPGEATDSVDSIVEQFWDGAQTALQENYKQPLMESVAALPLHELAALAEALVSLTAFRARMSADEAETVGGHIAVAVISKGDGFAWVREREMVGRNPLNNPQPTSF